MRPATPNHALQRTAPAVTLAAPPPSPAQPSRQPPPSLSLGSLGVATRIVKHIVFVIATLALVTLTFAGPPSRTQQLLSDYETVRRSLQFILGPIGEAGVTSSTEASFRRMLRASSAAHDCSKLLSDATTAGQLYGLLGLKLLNDPRYATFAPRYKASRSQVSVTGGCVIMPRPVSEIAKYIDTGELK